MDCQPGVVTRTGPPRRGLTLLSVTLTIALLTVLAVALVTFLGEQIGGCYYAWTCGGCGSLLEFNNTPTFETLPAKRIVESSTAPGHIHLWRLATQTQACGPWKLAHWRFNTPCPCKIAADPDSVYRTATRVEPGAPRPLGAQFPDVRTPTSRRVRR